MMVIEYMLKKVFTMFYRVFYKAFYKVYKITGEKSRINRHNWRNHTLSQEKAQLLFSLDNCSRIPSNYTLLR
jgi:hypothetical protein